jgi:hypothetical protein
MPLIKGKKRNHVLFIIQAFVRALVLGLGNENEPNTRTLAILYVSDSSILTDSFF